MKGTPEKILKIGKNTIFVEARMVSDNYRKVTFANFSVDPKHEKYSLTNNPLGNTWRIHQNKIITVGNESDTELAMLKLLRRHLRLPKILRVDRRGQLDSLPSHSITLALTCTSNLE